MLIQCNKYNILNVTWADFVCIKTIKKFSSLNKLKKLESETNIDYNIKNVEFINVLRKVKIIYIS